MDGNLSGYDSSCPPSTPSLPPPSLPPRPPKRKNTRQPSTQKSQNDEENEGEPTEQQPSTKKRKRTSAVWDHFQRFKVNDEDKAKCLHCDKILSASSVNGTSHLKDHLSLRCSKNNIKVDIRQKLLSVSRKSDGTCTLDATNFNQEVSRKELANMVIVHEYPLAIVDHIGFRRFVSSLNPSFKIISRPTLRADIMKLFTSEKAGLKKVLENTESKIATLKRIAKDILAILASTVASESAFSMGGRVISPHRSRLATNTVEALMCMQNWIIGDYSDVSLKNAHSCATILEDYDTVDVDTNASEVLDLDSGMKMTSYEVSYKLTECKIAY